MRLPQGLKHKRREMVATLWLQGYGIMEIASIIRDEAKIKGQKALEKTHWVTVSKDVRALQKSWLERTNEKIDEKRVEAVKRIRLVINKAWREYAHNITTRAQLLNVILNAEDKLAKVEGTYSPIKMAGAEGESLIPPPMMVFKLPDGVEIKPPRNIGSMPVEMVESYGNGGKPERH